MRIIAMKLIKQEYSQIMLSFVLDANANLIHKVCKKLECSTIENIYQIFDAPCTVLGIQTNEAKTT